MSDAPNLLTPAVRAAAQRSVLCWLATVDAQGQPHVSPKEVWTVADDYVLMYAQGVQSTHADHR